MPWEIIADHPQCPEGRPYGVVKSDGEIEGCHATEEAAQAQVDALYASEAEDVDDEGEDEAGLEPAALALDDTHRPPQGVRDEGQRALDWLAEGHAGPGFTDVGRRRASQLAAGDPVSVRTIKRMANYLSRHQGDRQGEGWRPGQDGYPSPGRVAWAAWGGDPAIPWTNKVLRGERANQQASMGLTAAADRAAFAAVLAIEGEVTGDGRLLAPGSLTWRELPLPLMFQDRTPEGQGSAHAGADFAGDIQGIERDGDRIVARGELDLGRPAGAELYRLLSSGSSLRGVSVDLDSVMAEYVDAEGRLIDTLDDGELMDVDPATLVQQYTSGRIMGATVTPFPAISGGASITLVTPEDAIAASGLRVEDVPPASWYEDPGLDAPTPITITAEGRIYGHVALWGQAHIGFDGRQVYPPHSPTGYRYFTTGAVEARCGTCPAGDIEQVPVGTLTLGGGHAPTAPGVGMSKAKAHYDEVGLAAAFVAAGEDQHGIWVAGTLAPGLSSAEVALLRASSPSGDWRVPPGGRDLELVALAAVNVPGFPVPRSRVHVAESQTMALAASAARLVSQQGPGDALAALEARVARLESIASPLRALAAEQYEQALGPRDDARMLRSWARGRRRT